MKTIHTFLPGSPEWKAHRAQPGIFNGSELAAIMGLSSYKTRNAILHEKATGIEPEHDAATLKRFADGHRAEELARPLAEEYIGEDLSAMCMSDVIDGVLISVSLDGITQNHTTSWEQKLLNKDLILALEDGHLPEEYRPQCEAGLMVSGATRCLFMASKDGDPDTAQYYWYTSRPGLPAQIIAACKQFAKDLAAYVPPVIVAEAVAAPIKDLPAIIYKMDGMTLTSNISSDVKPAVLELVELSKRKPVTDQDFADLDALNKKFKMGEDRCCMMRESVLAEIADVDKFTRDLQELEGLMRQARLSGEKVFKAENENRKTEIRAAGISAYAAHVASLQSEIKGVALAIAAPDWMAAGKGLKTLASLQNAIDTCLAAGKIAADAVARDWRTKLAWCATNAAGHSALFPDLQHLMLKPMEDFVLTITSRIETHKKAEADKLEAERKRMEADATAKAEREAAVKIEAETARIREEERVKALAEQAANDQRGKPQVGESEGANIVAQDQVGERQSTPPIAVTAVVGRPSRTQIIESVAKSFGVSVLTADEWLRNEFGRG